MASSIDIGLNFYILQIN